jgi:hypothetical protein
MLDQESCIFPVKAFKTPLWIKRVEVLEFFDANKEVDWKCTNRMRRARSLWAGESN